MLLWHALVQSALFEGMANYKNYNDDDFPPKTLDKCNKNITSSLLTSCIARIRLMLSYNSLRNEIASGRYYGHPTVGNMLRTKWLMSVERYTHDSVHHCHSSIPPESNVVISGDPYESNYTYTCDVIYVNKLFEDWCLDEIIDFMIEASFKQNFFDDFDEFGGYKRISIEGFGCSINLDNIGVLTTEAFMGCGFCTALPIIKPVMNVKPCSLCDYIPSDVEAIPSMCDYHFRSLCTARNSKIDKRGIDTDYSLTKIETECESQEFLIAETRKLIPRKINADPVLFFKVTYILPMLTIGLLVYYMTVIKKQRIVKIKIPKQLHNVQ